MSYSFKSNGLSCQTPCNLIYWVFFINKYSNNNTNIYLLQLGCHRVAVVIYMYTKYEIG